MTEVTEHESYFPEVPPLYTHQETTKNFGLTTPRVYDMSDPGTGKTRSWLEVVLARLETLPGKVLVLAPKSILEPAWGADIQRFAKTLTFSIAHASNRARAFAAEADIYITNHDAVKWIANNMDVLTGRGFHTIIIDEITAFKHHTSQRSKALAKIVEHFDYRVGMSGTPNPNGLLDLHHQILLLDDGAHLGREFYKFRHVVCEPKQVGPNPVRHIRWDDRVGAADAVADMLDDMTVRHVFEECLDIPENNSYVVKFNLSPKHAAAYEVLKQHAMVEIENGRVTAFNAGVLANKLLQMSSGAVYVDEKVSEVFSTARYELVLDLIEAREQCVVAFNWRHQREQLTALAEKRKIKFAVLDGSVSHTRRVTAVDDFQNGFIKVIFAHPATASHGLTLTKGTSTIWASPVYNAEHFQQFNRRIYRAGQERKTETVLIAANNTIDEEVYDKLAVKLDRMADLLEMCNG